MILSGTVLFFVGIPTGSVVFARGSIERAMARCVIIRVSRGLLQTCARRSEGMRMCIARCGCGVG